ncbi:MAG: transglycosylase domain-containing protein, partial [Bacteroidota bacterium]
MAAQTKKKSTSKKVVKDPNRRHIRTFWKIVAGGVFLILLLFLAASWGLFGKLPDISEYENPEKDLATQVIAEDGKVIGKFFKENRTPVQFEDLPDHLVNALIATEDVRFYNHAGIDGYGTVRAFAFLGQRGGASTISQQCAKQFFTDGASRNKFQRGLQKIKEMIIATKLERRYTKEEIITMYFNVYDFLNLAIGIESASNIYFNKAPQALNVEEGAMLVGMFKNSSLYNPLKNPEGVTNRRNVVLSQMAKYDFITEEVKDSLQALPLGVNYSPQKHIDGIGTYVREYIRGYMKEWSKQNPKPDGSYYDIDRDGLKVYTTINSKMQAYAEQAVGEHMPRLQAEFNIQNKKNKIAPFRDITNEEINTIMQAAMRRSDRWREMKDKGISEDKIIESFNKETEMSIFSWTAKNKTIDTIMTPMDSIRYYKAFFGASLMSMTPQTGEIKAWVGGIDYKNFKYDMVKKGKRQIGSTFKPFVYSTAIDQMHMSPCDTLPNTPFCIEEGKYGLLKEWCPKNSSGNYGGMMTLRGALAQSVNTITARLIDRVGPRPVIDLAEKMGVDTKEVPEVPSIALGTADITLYEMVGAYSTFVNEGVYVKPVLVSRIEDKNGTVLFQNIPETKDVISNETAYVTVSLLQGVTQSGSGSRLRGKWRANAPVYKKIITGYPYEFENPIAGKTGTTQNNSDGWFMGMVPNLATGVWVGGEDRATHFANTSYGQGASMALPIWGIYMKKCYADPELNVSKDN